MQTAMMTTIVMEGRSYITTVDYEPRSTFWRCITAGVWSDYIGVQRCRLRCSITAISNGIATTYLRKNIIINLFSLLKWNRLVNWRKFWLFANVIIILTFLHVCLASELIKNVGARCLVKVTIDELDEDDHVTSMGDATTAAVNDAHVMRSTPLSSLSSKG